MAKMEYFWIQNTSVRFFINCPWISNAYINQVKKMCFVYLLSWGGNENTFRF
jgi:hypothetical protein